jgi:chromosome partitioning protein
MSKIISIMNQKGGVGKSTTAQALRSGLYKKGFSILLIDLDPQGNTTYTIDASASKNTIYEILTKKSNIKNALIKTEQGDLIKSSICLTKLELELNTTGKEYKLKEALEPIKKQYNYIIIDTPPALGTLTINALTTSDSIIIPSQADIYSLQGIGQLMETINTIKKYCNPKLKIQGILLTRYKHRTILSKDMLEMIEDTASKINTFVYKTVIREAIAIKEAQASKQDIFTYAPKNNASIDYLNFINEFIERS